MSFKEFLNEQEQVSKQLIEKQEKRERLRKEMKSLIEKVNLLEKAVSPSQKKNVNKEIIIENNNLPVIKKESVKITRPILEQLIVEKDFVKLYEFSIIDPFKNMYNSWQDKRLQKRLEKTHRQLIQRIISKMSQINKKYKDTLDQYNKELSPVMNKYSQILTSAISEIQEIDELLSNVSTKYQDDEAVQNIRNDFNEFLNSLSITTKTIDHITGIISGKKSPDDPLPPEVVGSEDKTPEAAEDPETVQPTFDEKITTEDVGKLGDASKKVISNSGRIFGDISSFNVILDRLIGKV